MDPRLDHIGLDVSDYVASRAFYEQALAPLGMRCIMEPVPNVGGFGDDFPFFWIAERGRGPDSGTHVAFRAPDHATVDAFHATYYGAFVLDPDGNNVEAVCHGEPGG
jgi:catechol 2,3-dioxygenase-like lactoylglutathione lyase family enzyme